MSDDDEYESSDTEEEFATDVGFFFRFQKNRNIFDRSLYSYITQDLFQSSPSPKGRERKKPPLRPKRSESPTKVEESRVCTLFKQSYLNYTHSHAHTQLLDTSRGLMRLSGSGRRSFNAQLRSMESSVRL